ncbi:hypothetical protein Tco_0840225 [Tanacetum coccineum]|uniref:Uncharacterized protein n=1 Tax=Tanacetum coccineum TaxID=301880 RepID=A0ABQ5AWZ9_9ASTR
MVTLELDYRVKVTSSWVLNHWRWSVWRSLGCFVVIQREVVSGDRIEGNDSSLKEGGGKLLSFCICCGNLWIERGGGGHGVWGRSEGALVGWVLCVVVGYLKFREVVDGEAMSASATLNVRDLVFLKSKLLNGGPL